MDIGIDLGTTYSVIAVKGKVKLAAEYGEGIYLPEVDVTVIPTPQGDPIFPSVLWFDPANPTDYIVGAEAKAAIDRGESPIMFSKRFIGTQHEFQLHDRKLTARDVAREVLKYLKRCAELALDQPVHRAVVTHPAYFDPGQVAETRQAAQDAGFDMALPEQTMMEPVAAALAYTVSDPRDPLVVMVYDLGGGTFDTSVLERRGGFIDCKAFDGNRLLGGYNFDRQLVNWVLDKLKAKRRVIPYDEKDPVDRGRRAQLLAIAENVKMQLSKQRSNKVPVQFQAPNVLVDDQGQRVQVLERITREEFTALIREELLETIDCCRKAVEKSGKKIDELNAVLLAGSSTYGPWVTEVIREGLGVEPQPTFSPDLIVGVGAALQAARLGRPESEGANCRVRLDVPATSTLDEITLTGFVQRHAPEKLEGLSVLLHTPQGKTLGPIHPDLEGKFLFESVALLVDGPTRFKLEISDTGGVSQHKEEFTVTYLPDDNNVGDFLPILTKMLYVRTREGLVPLAEEGQKLPAKCEVSLERLFDDSTYDEPIYLDDQPIGIIRVEDIPKEAGIGAKIRLNIEVTGKGQIRGKVQILTRTGTVVKDAPVKVSFPPLPVPTKAELEQKFQRLEDKRHDLMALTEDAELRTLLAGKGGRMAETVQKKFGEQEPDRQEIEASLRELERLVSPPSDDLEPPRSRFDSLLVNCRELIAANKDNPQIQHFAATVDRCEREGRDAYLRKDRRRWAAINDSLAHLRASLEAPATSKEERPLSETPILKDQADLMADQVRGKLRAVEDSLKADERYVAKFKPRCDAVAVKLDQIKTRIRDIPDNTPNKQALSKIQLVLRDLHKLEQKDLPEIPFESTGR